MNATIQSLHIYPVKGFKGIELSSAVLTEKGFAYDRHWMLINPKNQFVTQRQLPRFALMSVALTKHELILSLDDEKISINLEYSAPESNQSLQATIWGDECEVMAENDDVSAWITEKLKAPWPLRLVRMRNSFQRRVDQSDKLGAGKTVTTNFADGFPFLVANQASLNELNRFSGKQYPMDRFRPNIVLDAEQPFIEHSATKLIINEIEISLDFPCERCVVTTIDQATAQKDPQQEPLKSLIQLNPMPNKVNAAAFGQNASLVAGNGLFLKSGDICQLELSRS